jgi:hypothetical protein
MYTVLRGKIKVAKLAEDARNKLKSVYHNL